MCKHLFTRLLPMVLTLTIIGSGTAFAGKDYRQFRKGQTIYVHSIQELSLRYKPSTSSRKISSMKYGSELLVLTDSDQTKKITYGNIDGHWTHVQFGLIRGYAFSGLLSRFPNPENSSFNDYQQSLQGRGMTDSNDEPSQIVASRAKLVLREASIIDGFLVARKLFGIPERFAFPVNSKMAVTIVHDPQDHKGTNGKSVQILRDKKGYLEEIIYYDKNKKWSYRSCIKRNKNGSIELILVRHNI